MKGVRRIVCLSLVKYLILCSSAGFVASYRTSLDGFAFSTLSLLSRASFLAHPGPLANVTTERWLNQYSYDNRNLLLSYGIALALGLAACVYGCTSIYRNESSYSNKFSTILRTTKGHLEGFDALLTKDDRSGTDPLPGRLARAKLVLGSGGVGGEGLVWGDGREDEVELERRQQQQQQQQQRESFAGEDPAEQGTMADDSGRYSQEQDVEYVGLPTQDVSSESSRESHGELQRRSSVSTDGEHSVGGGRA